MTVAAIKVTPAMREWCSYIALPREARLLRLTHPDFPLHVHYRTEGWPRRLKPTWAMADKLLAAGLIRWHRYGRQSQGPQHIALLTRAGRAEVNAGVQDTVRPQRDAWPFPVSAHQERA